MHIAEAIATDHYTAIQFVYRADNLCTIIAYQTDIIPVSKQKFFKIFASSSFGNAMMISAIKTSRVSVTYQRYCLYCSKITLRLPVCYLPAVFFPFCILCRDQIIRYMCSQHLTQELIIFKTLHSFIKRPWKSLTLSKLFR